MQACRIDGQGLLQLGAEVGRLQLARRYIDADLQLQAGGVPLGHLLQGGLYHPVADINDQVVVFHQGQKFQRAQNAALGVLPAQQGLHAGHTPQPHVDLGLVVQLQFAAQQRLVHACGTVVAVAVGAVFFGVKNAQHVFAGQLGAVHGLVGMAQQGVGALVIQRKQRHPGAGREAGRIRKQGERHGNLAEQAQDRVAAFVGVAQAHQQHYKFVTAQARHGIATAQHRAHAPGHFDQHAVAGLVAPDVVDGLEAVQVQVADRHQGFGAPALGHAQQQAVHQQHAVGQLGQRIKVSHLFELAFLLLDRADVREHRHVVGERAIGGVHRRDRQQLGVDLTVLVAVPDFAFPAAGLGNVFPHRRIESGVVFARLEHAGVATQYLAAFPTGDAGKGRVDVDDVALCVGEGDAVVAVAKGGGVQLQLLLGHQLCLVALVDFLVGLGQ